MNELIMLVGIVASGKSLLAEQYREKGYIIHSSDELRKELLKDASRQDKNNLVFEILHENILRDLEQGKNVVYDATNLVSKRRKSFLNTVKSVKKKAVVMATPLEICLQQNDTRERHVPEDVIDRMYKSFQIPIPEEGFDEIDIVFHDDIEWGDYVIRDMLEEMQYFNQDNPHHSKTLGRHCISCHKYLLQHDDSNLQRAGLLHDIGKMYTKSFVNSKGETTKVCHYYNHENVSAYLAMFYLGENEYMETNRILDICKLINYHMSMFNMTTDKAKQRLINKVGERDYKRLLILHEADKHAK